MNTEAVNQIQAKLNKVDSALTDAHLAMEDRTTHCFDKDLSDTYNELAELRLMLKNIEELS